MKLSCYIMTKNNEKSLGWALASIHQYIDELIIIDSGSTDKTLEIAEHFGAKIYDRTLDSFSNQRNFAITKCTGDWIYCMDSDEVMGENFPQVLKYLQNAKWRSLLLPRYNLVSLEPGVHISSYYHYSDWQTRFVRNDGRCYYELPVHEQLKNGKPRLKVPNVNIFHLNWLLNDYSARKVHCEFYDKINPGGGFRDYYLFEECTREVKFLQTIEKIAPPVMELLLRELKPVSYEYRIDKYRQLKYKTEIFIKSGLTDLRNMAGL